MLKRIQVIPSFQNFPNTTILSSMIVTSLPLQSGADFFDEGEMKFHRNQHIKNW